MKFRPKTQKISLALLEMLRAFLRRGAGAVLLLLAGTAFSACVTFSPEEDREPELSPSALRPVGHVVWVDSAERTAVVYLHRGASLSGGNLISRNDALYETGRLEPSGAREGRTAGMRVIDGLPNAGDEVVLAP